MSKLRYFLSQFFPFFFNFRGWIRQDEKKNLHPFPELTCLIDNFNKQDVVPDLLCFGDSVWERLSYTDLDRRTVAEMLNDRLNDYMKVVAISHSAYNMRTYLGLIKALEKMRGRPKYVVLPVNLRSFSPQWFLNPLWQFKHENQVLEEYYANPEMKIPVIVPVAEERGFYDEFNKTLVYYPLSEYRTIREFREVIAIDPVDEAHAFARLRQIFIFHYMHQLTSEHLLIQCLDEILRRLVDMDIETLVYITPINYQAGVRFCGNDFSKQIGINSGLVYDVIRNYFGDRVRYRDLGCLLSSDYFFGLDNATEHLNEKGRSMLIEQLAAELILMMNERKANGNAFKN